MGRAERGFQFPQELLECCFCFETVLPSVSLSYSVSLSDQLQHMCSMFTGASLLMHPNMRLGSDSKACVLEDRMSVLLIA